MQIWCAPGVFSRFGPVHATKQPEQRMLLQQTMQEPTAVTVTASSGPAHALCCDLLAGTGQESLPNLLRALALLWLTGDAHK